MGRVDGKVALVTGAARGQGRSHAVRLAEEGADVIAIDICQQMPSIPYEMGRSEELQETEDLVSKFGNGVMVREVDVRDQSALDSLVSEALERFGHIDVVASNAAVISYQPVWELTEEVWQDVINVNLSGAWRTIKAVAPSMIQHGAGGSIILTSSVAGMKGMKHNAHYCASKHGLTGLMRSACLELADHGIRVNTINPGGVLTGMIDNEMTYRLFRPDLPDPTLADVAAISTEMHAMGIPWLEPIDISNAVVFLASDEARYITGAVLPVDAGMSTL
jgi:SDR family mycofactocin-dependent oxidoreductase